MTDALSGLAVDGDVATASVARRHVRRLCEGHFPGDPFVPGAYLVELMATLAAVLVATPRAAPAAIERAAFHRPVRPDDAIDVVAVRRGPGRADVEVRTGGRTAARAGIRFEACG